MAVYESRSVLTKVYAHIVRHNFVGTRLSTHSALLHRVCVYIIVVVAVVWRLMFDVENRKCKHCTALEVAKNSLCNTYVMGTSCVAQLFVGNKFVDLFTTKDRHRLTEKMRWATMYGIYATFV